MNFVSLSTVRSESIAFVCATPGERITYNWEYTQVASRPNCDEHTLLWAHAYAKSVVLEMRREARRAAESKRAYACCTACALHESHREAILNSGGDCCCECEKGAF